MLSGERPSFGGKQAPVIDRHKDIQVMLQPGLIILLPMTRSGMNQPRTIFPGHIIHRDHPAILF